MILPHIHQQAVYEPGKPISEVARELDIPEDNFKKLASNENLWGASPLVEAAIKNQVRDLMFYPDGGTFVLKQELARHLGVEENQLIFGNGSNEVIEMLAQVTLSEGDEVVIGADSFPVYKMAALQRKAVPVSVPMQNYCHDLEAMSAAVTEKTKLVFLPSPNNPTGTANPVDEIEAFARRLPHRVMLVLDEAYIEYVEGRSVNVSQLLEEGCSVLALRTFSKIYGIPAVRIGYGYGDASIVQAINRVRQPFNINSFAQAAAVAAIQDQVHIQQIKEWNAAARKVLFEALTSAGFTPVRSEANFVFFPISDARLVFEKLLRKGWITRPIGLQDGSTGLRVTVYQQEWMTEFVADLSNLVQD